MTPQPELVNRIVSNVLRQLTTGNSGSAACPATDAQAATPAQPPQPSAPDLPVLILSTQVVTEASLRAAAAGGRTIALPRGAIITPSGREFIRQQRVTLTASSATETPPGTCGLLLHSTETSSATVVAAASAAGWSARGLGGDFEIAQTAAQELHETSVVCCCAESSVVACLLNRDPDIRAAVAAPATDLSTLLPAMNPQVICIGQKGWSVTDVRRVLQAVDRHPRTSPQDWAEISQGATT